MEIGEVAPLDQVQLDVLLQDYDSAREIGRTVALRVLPAVLLETGTIDHVPRVHLLQEDEPFGDGERLTIENRLHMGLGIHIIALRDAMG